MATFKPGETGDISGKGGARTSRVRALAARSLYNARTPLDIVRGRLAHRPAFYPHLPWGRWFIACLVLAAVSLALFDPIVGRREDHWPWFFAAAAASFTRLGLGVWYVVPPLLWLCFANLVDWHALSRRWKMRFYNWTGLAYFMLIAVATSGLTSVLLKTAIGRARPLNYEKLGLLSFHPFVFDARFASFPSGHATVIGTVAAILLLLFPRWKYPVLIFAVWVASTRIFVGAHYPSDTIIGFGMGFGATVALAVLFARLGFVFLQTPTGLPVRRNTFRIFGMPGRKTQPRLAEAVAHT